MLRRQVAQPRFKPHDRLLLAVLSRALPRHCWNVFLVRPETRRIHKLGVAESNLPACREDQFAHPYEFQVAALVKYATWIASQGVVVGSNGSGKVVRGSVRSSPEPGATARRCMTSSRFRRG
jgi:hypothetical protein